MAEIRRITPDVWGGPLWRAIHVVAMGYPSSPSGDVKQAYRQFYASLETVIPCAICAEGYTAIVRDNPIDQALGNKEDLFNWTVLVHNKVSEKLGKPPMTPEYVRQVYMFGDECPGDASDIDPAVIRTNWTIVSVYGAAFIVMIAIALALFWIFRLPSP